MMERKLKIIIAGEANTGKSSVSYLISEYLKSLGLTVELVPDQDYLNREMFDFQMSRNISERISCLSRNKIQIQTKQLNRDAEYNILK